MSHQPHSRESDTPASPDARRPIHAGESDVASRIRSLIGDEPQVSFARRCGIGETTLRKYLAGAQPSTDRLVAIADTAGVSIEWLAAGRGTRSRGAPRDPVKFDDLARLQATIEAVEEGLRSINRKLAPDKYAELVAVAYTLMDPVSPAGSRVVQFIKAAA